MKDHDKVVCNTPFYNEQVRPHFPEPMEYPYEGLMSYAHKYNNYVHFCDHSEKLASSDNQSLFKVI